MLLGFLKPRGTLFKRMIACWAPLIEGNYLMELNFRGVSPWALRPQPWVSRFRRLFQFLGLGFRVLEVYILQVLFVFLRLLYSLGLYSADSCFFHWFEVYGLGFSTISCSKALSCCL